MTVIKTNGVMQQLRRAALLPSGGDISDADLLHSFIHRHDEAAFEALIRRHGPMVLGVARRILQHAQDAEDAFQATFLVLVRKAGSIMPRALVGHWLYGVAIRTAMKAKAMKSKRRARESQARPQTRPVPSHSWEELAPLLDRELAALPAKYRLPVFLCDLEGKTHREAARQLGWPAGTLETRLTAGRQLLARRLTRQGVTLSAGGVAAILAQNAASAALPPALVATTLKAGMLYAAGPAMAAAAVSTHITALAQGVLNAMLLNKIKIAAGLSLAIAVLCTLPNVLTQSAAQPISSPKTEAGKEKPLHAYKDPLRQRLESREWQVRSVDPAKQTITVQDRGDNTWAMGLRYVETTPGNFGPSGLILRDLKLEKEARIMLDGKPAKLADLKPETRLSLRFAPERFRLLRIDAFASAKLMPAYVLKEIVPARNTISVALKDWDGETRLDALPLAKNADIEIHSDRGMRKAALRDLEPGMTVHLELAPDDAGKLIVRAIKAAK